jgi:glycosyltransferase involved in cell wall biosynthesis
MWKLSEKALIKKVNRTNSDNIIIGYFSVSLYHNSDIEIIKKALIKILKEFKNAKLFLIGEFEINEFLAEFSSQIINKTYIDWKELIEIISNFDTYIIPLEYNIFNQNETGILCNNSNDWYISLKTLINNEEIRKYIGENAYNFCKKNYNSIYVGSRFANYINSIANKHIGFFIPCLLNSGGMYVILKHACILKDKGWDVDLILPNSNIDLYEFHHYKFNIISLNNTLISSQYDVIVATLYTTIYTTLSYYKTKKHVYLVQNYETDFNSYGNYFRTIAEKTYSIPFNVEYITISKWCKNWLFEKYKKKSKYAPNGIDVSEFKSHKRDLKIKK